MPPPNDGMLPFVWNGDLYEIYHANGRIARVFVTYDNTNTTATELDLPDISLELLHKLEDRINLNK